MLSRIVAAAVFSLLLGPPAAWALPPRCAALPLAPRPCALPAMSKAEAQALLWSHDDFAVRHLEPVGDYWQGEIATPKGPETVYVLADGQVLHAPPLIGAP
ncbi:MAG TPA: hypothetical protein VLV85_07540 [Stellaceae bacterium]|nr:hypothetical protein [Stellaceae bacterium]